MTSSATPADWLLAEYEAIDIDELIERLEAIPWRPMFTLESVLDPGEPMRVQTADYRDPDRWWL